MTTEAAMLEVEIVYALSDRSWTVRHLLAAPATVGQALQCGLPEVPGLKVDPARLAVFGRAVGLDTPLHDGDRIELLRPLVMDPKEARRRRAGARRGG
jgi:uncharacterized protein